jgi:hypothetical protein
MRLLVRLFRERLLLLRHRLDLERLLAIRPCLQRTARLLRRVLRLLPR